MNIAQKSNDILKEEFERRILSNKSYSARAFAKDIGLSSSMARLILNNQRTLSRKKALVVSRNLGFNEVQHDLFVNLVTVEGGANQEEKKVAQEKLEKILQFKPKKSLSEEESNLISKWFFAGIISCLQLDEYDGSVAFISQQLNLSETAVEKYLNILIKLNLVEFRGGRFTSSVVDLTSTHDIPSEALKNAHESFLAQATNAIRAVDVDKRDITYMTMGIDKAKLPEAKRLIKDFRRNLTKFMESGKKEEVYSLNIQFFPLKNFKK